MFVDEDNKIELKEILNGSLPKEIVAFLNSEGGTIYIGVNKKREIVGIEKIDETMRQISDIITDQISPRCVEFVKQEHDTIDGKEVIKINILSGNRLFYIKKYGLSENGCYIRVGSSCKSLTPEEIEDRFIKSLNIKEVNIIDIPSARTQLSFKILKNYLISNNNHICDDTFLENYHLLTKDGKYNYLAEILADNNDIVINVATFSSSDKSQYLKREEFGGKCLLLAMEQAKNYINSINQTFVNLETTPRKEIKMFDTEAFEQAWINACVHNKWSESNHPGIYVYNNRIEIESFGGIPKVLTKEQFIKGKSEPVNKQLFDIFRACNFAEESGHGVPSVVSVYGEEAYIFSEFYIDVIIPFDKNGFNKATSKSDRKQPDKVRESVVDLLKSNGKLSRKDLSLLLGVTEGSIRHHLNKLQEDKIIRHVGPDKGGYWEVLK
ncbi:MAG: putative DNA binding domain-containing protein [Bacilli bacterium]|nr:putative DNA binding domain-containing protein [Bacilli bacterium]